jgi:hypothetical protein
MAIANKHKVLSPSNLSIIGLSEDLTPDTATDYLATYDASAGKNKRVLLDNLGLGGGGNSFTIMQADSGTSPTADSSTDTLTFTSSDSSILISGDSSTDTLDFTADYSSSLILDGGNDSISSLTDAVLYFDTAKKNGFTTNGTGNNLGVWNNNIRRLYFTTTAINVENAPLVLENGAVGTPRISFAGMLDGGLWRNSTNDSLNISVNGVNKMEWDDNYTDSTVPLTVSGNGASTIPLVLTGSASQTANLFDIENSASSALFSITSDGTVKVGPNGSNANCAIGWLDKANSGLYKSGNQLYVTANGTAVFDCATSRVVTGVPLWATSYTTPATPSYSFSGMSNGGLWRNSTNDSVNIAVNGVNLMEWDDNYCDSTKPLGVPSYATGSLPTASSHTARIVFDSTTSQFKGSDGTSWNVLG